MKKKTSISISKKVLEAVRRVAKKHERSVSYVIEKFIEEKVNELPDEENVLRMPSQQRRVIYPNKRKKRGGKAA
jgi:predicted DNA-binding protein